MDGKRKYPRCKIFGHGELYAGSSGKWEEFEVEDLSAAGIKILTRAELNEGDEVNLNITFSVYVAQVDIRVSGRVLRKAVNARRNAYSVQFLKMSQQDRTEIDELVRSSCSLGNSITLSCEDGDCTFFKK